MKPYRQAAACGNVPVRSADGSVAGPARRCERLGEAAGWPLAAPDSSNKGGVPIIAAVVFINDAFVFINCAVVASSGGRFDDM